MPESSTKRIAVILPRSIIEAMKTKTKLPASEMVRRALQQFFSLEYDPVRRGRPRKKA